MWILVYLLIISTAVIFAPLSFNDPWWIPKEAVFNVLSGWIIGLSLFFDKKKRFKNIWIGMILIFTLTSYCWYFFSPLVFAKGKVLWQLWNFRPTLNIVLGTILLIVLVEHSEVKRWITCAKVLCWVGFGLSVYAILQWFGLDQFFGTHQFNVPYIGEIAGRKTRMVTFMGNSFLTSNYLAALSPLCLMFRQRRYMMIYVLIGLSLLLMDSKISIIAFGAGLIIYLFLNGKFRQILITFCILVLLSVLSIFVFNDSWSFNGRIELWRDVLSAPMIFTGNGLGSFAFSFKSGGKDVLHAHNEILQIWHEGGIALFVLVGGYVIDFLRRLVSYFSINKNIVLIGYASGLICLFVVSLAGFPLRIAPLAVLGIIYLACLESQMSKGVIYG